jgi:hypothetical protein
VENHYVRSNPRLFHEIRAGHYVEIPGNVCTYCGDPATVRDHFLPVAVAASMQFGPKLKLILPSCVECNGIASDHAFKTVADKRLFIQARLAKKYRSLVNSPSWTESELEELGWSMRTLIQAEIARKTHILARLKWLNAPSAESLLLSVVPGSGSAPRSVE